MGTTSSSPGPWLQSGKTASPGRKEHARTHTQDVKPEIITHPHGNPDQEPTQHRQSTLSRFHARLPLTKPNNWGLASSHEKETEAQQGSITYQGHTVGKQQSWDYTSGLPAPGQRKFISLNPMSSLDPCRKGAPLSQAGPFGEKPPTSRIPQQEGISKLLLPASPQCPVVCPGSQFAGATGPDPLLIRGHVQEFVPLSSSLSP